MGVGDGFGEADSREAETLDYDSYAFVVEVRHDDWMFVSVLMGRGEGEQKRNL